MSFLNQTQVTGNPIRNIRVLHNYTLEDLAELTHISSHAVYMNEVGVYPNLLPALALYFVDELGYTLAELKKQYSEYRDRKRRLQRDFSFSNPAPDDERYKGLHPVAAFYKHNSFQSESAFAKSFLIHPATLYSVIKSVSHYSLPPAFKEAFLECWVSESVYNELNYRSQEFYNEYHRLRKEREVK